jgi:hypothetical protein
MIFGLAAFARCRPNQRLGILRNYFQMRGLLWIVVLAALATSLDSSLYGGFYTQAVARMLSDIALHFG